MFETIQSLISFIRPPENATPKQMHRWGWNVALTLLGVVGFAIWTLSPYGFLSADAAEGRIQEAITPLKKELGTVKDQVTDINKKLQVITNSQVESQRLSMQTKIIEYKEKFCKAPSVDSAQTWKNLYLEYQNQCISIFGETSQTCIPPTCSDIK